jgi:hypothetical protein
MSKASAHPVRFLLTYDIRPDIQDRYFQFMLGEMVPALQQMGLAMNGAWHTAYGNYPMRLVEFIAEDRDTLERVLDSTQWEQLEARLQSFVLNYSRKTVPLRENYFQF